MAQPYMQSVYETIPFTTDLTVLCEAGAQPTKLGGMFQLFSMVIDTLFRNRIDAEVFTSVKSGISDYRMRYDRRTPSIVNIFDERHFSDFCGLASRMNYKDTESTDFEKTLGVECIFTDDEKFKVEDIPLVSSDEEYQKVLEGKTPFCKDSIYFIKVDSVASNSGIQEKYIEYLIYTPSEAILAYN